MVLITLLTFGLIAFGAVLAMEDMSPIEKERQRARQQAGDFANRLREIVNLPALYAYPWMPAPLQSKINAFMETRAKLSADAKALYMPILEAVDKLGTADPFELFSQIDTASINRQGLYSRAAQAAIEGAALATEAIDVGKKLFAEADAEAVKVFEQCGEDAIEDGWPAEVFENQKAWEFYVRRNLRYRAAKGVANDLTSNIQGIQNEMYALQRRVDEIRVAASRAASRALAV